MRVDGEGGDDAPAPAEKPSTSARSWDPPPTLAFLTHLTRPGGYGLDASDVRTSVSAWREAEIVATLVRNAKRKAPDAVVGRIFTAVNQDGIVVLIGEAGRGDDAGGGGGSTARRDDESDDERHLRDCHLSVCHLDPPVNLGAPDGRNARAVMLVMVPDDGPSKEAPWARGMDQHGAMRTIKAAFHGFARHGALLKSIDRAEKTAESDRGKAMIADLIGAVSGGFTPRAGSGSGEESVFASPEKREPSLDGGGGKSGGARKSLSLEHDHRKPSSKKSHVLTPEEYVRAIQTAIGSYVAAEEQKQRRKRAAEDDAESESDYEGKPPWGAPWRVVARVDADEDRRRPDERRQKPVHPALRVRLDGRFIHEDGVCGVAHVFRMLSPVHRVRGAHEHRDGRKDGHHGVHPRAGGRGYILLPSSPGSPRSCCERPARRPCFSSSSTRCATATTRPSRRRTRGRGYGRRCSWSSSRSRTRAC